MFHWKGINISTLIIPLFSRISISHLQYLYHKLLHRYGHFNTSAHRALLRICQFYVTRYREISDSWLSEKLSTGDLANLSCASRQLNYLITPHLYHTIHFHCRGVFAPEDQVFRKLDIFGDPRFSKLQHTSRLYVTGSWYHTYKEIESDLGQQGIFSPAARMFSNIISSCIVRMPHLKEFMYVHCSLLQNSNISPYSAHLVQKTT